MTPPPTTKSPPTTYSEDELMTALESLYISGDRNDACNHLHGYNNNNSTTADTSSFFKDGHVLSALQKITAMRILDYRDSDYVVPEEPKEQTSNEISEIKISPLNLLDVIKSLSSTTTSSSSSSLLPSSTSSTTTTSIMALAAEFKRASPSKGNIAPPGMKISNQISLYAQSGASVISVLTEERHFKGSLNDLRFARDAIMVSSESTGGGNNNNNNRPALLRKDFIMNTRMIDEAIAAGADTVLLIVAILPKPLLKKLIDHCRTYLTVDKVPIEPLVEVHTLPIELDVALECGAKVIGVNNRNLHTFKLDMRTTECAAKIMMEKGLNFDHRDNNNNNNNNDNEYALCALSGMSGPDDVERYRSVGVGMVLVGEGLMRSNDPAATIRSFGLDPSINNTNSFSSNQNKASKEVDTTFTKDATIAPNNTIVIPQSYTSGTKLIKVCGITRPADALEACSAGANLIGIIFASRSKRKIESNEHAIQIVNVVRNFGERDARISFDNKLVVDDSIIQTTFCKLSNKAQTLQNVVSRTPLVVGVFQDQDVEYVKNTALATGLDLIQLHGNEGMEASSSTNYGGIPVIRVIDVEVGGVTTQNDEPNVIAKGIAKAITSHPIAILLDSTVRSTTTTIKGGGGTGGGTGKTFDWRIAHELQKLGLPVIMAGGLSSVNVRDAVSGCSGLGEVEGGEGGGGGGKCGGPWGIDASSGLEVEGRPGVKDVERLRGYVSGARLAAAENWQK